MGGSGDQMAAGGEGVGEGGVGSQEALGRARRAKTQHLPLAQPDWHMRAFRPVVLALALDMLRAQAQIWRWIIVLLQKEGFASESV